MISDEGLNLFDKCTTACVHMCPQKEECTSSYWGDNKMCTPDTIANSQRAPTKIKEMVLLPK